MRIKRPDTKDARSLLEAAHQEMKFTLHSLTVSEEAASTIVRNIYECFRMLGDALLTWKGIESTDHLQPIHEILKLDVHTVRPLQMIDHLRRLRHNINYYGYKPTVEEAEEAISIARSCFEAVYQKVKALIEEK
ncbi:MAG: hypothetical protein AABX37_06215 [Nanoarchaeota archaeon]